MVAAAFCLRGQVAIHYIFLRGAMPPHFCVCCRVVTSRNEPPLPPSGACGLAADLPPEARQHRHIGRGILFLAVPSLPFRTFAIQYLLYVKGIASDRMAGLGTTLQEHRIPHTRIDMNIGSQTLYF